MFQVPSSKIQDYKRGFTVFELLIVLGFIVILSIVIIPSLSERRSRIDLDNTAKKIVTLLREAQSRSMAQASSTSWGVHFENSATTTPFYALFATSYATGTRIGYYRLPPSIRYATSSVAEGGSLDIIFAQITGLPSTSTSITLELAGSGGGASGQSVTRSGSGKIFFDDFNRSSL
jgi:type II secretory pathway pseudopilin PulG